MPCHAMRIAGCMLYSAGIATVVLVLLVPKLIAAFLRRYTLARSTAARTDAYLRRLGIGTEEVARLRCVGSSRF